VGLARSNGYKFSLNESNCGHDVAYYPDWPPIE
jgi:hypothetical protein